MGILPQKEESQPTNQKETIHLSSIPDGDIVLNIVLTGESYSHNNYGGIDIVLNIVLTRESHNHNNYGGLVTLLRCCVYT